MTIPEFWGVVRKIDGLAGLEDKHETAIASLRAYIDDLKARITWLEAREDIVVVEAKAAAATAAGFAAIGFMSDIARRVGVLEAMTGQTGLPRLSPT